MIDVRSLQSGNDYSKLKNVIIIMVLPYDPFGCDQILYTVKNTCLEDPKVLYEDGALNLFLYTKGRNGAVSQELKDLLQYLENTTWNNAVNDSLKEVQTMVDQVKQNKEVSISYMMLYEREQRALRRAREEAWKEAREEGFREGFTDSIKSVLSELGAIPEDVAERVSGEDNRDILERWLKLAARSDSIEEFIQKM